MPSMNSFNSFMAYDLYPMEKVTGRGQEKFIFNTPLFPFPYSKKFPSVTPKIPSRLDYPPEEFLWDFSEEFAM
ncbi:unnamed protein product [Hymenolepis diminuta]|uniref:Uncharacterized protein n=1 Tax=Hymenolepis diminuta TaxID=6216 RepID=A0A564ZCP0_HYMDI|nr:unnamed protein product [Hymenolepis diminuta]